MRRPDVGDLREECFPVPNIPTKVGTVNFAATLIYVMASRKRKNCFSSILHASTSEGVQQVHCFNFLSFFCSTFFTHFLLGQVRTPGQTRQSSTCTPFVQLHTLTGPGFWTCCWQLTGWNFSSLVWLTQHPFLLKKTRKETVNTELLFAQKSIERHFWM